MHIVRTEVARLVVQMVSRGEHVEERQVMLRGNFRQHFAERLDFVRIAIAEYEFVPRLVLLFAALENSFVVHRHRCQEDDLLLGNVSLIASEKNDVGVVFFYLTHTVRGGMMTE